MPINFTVTLMQLCILHTYMAHTEQTILVFSFLVFFPPKTSLEQLLCLDRGSYCSGGDEKN